ncbi:peroxin 14/17 [Metarhizium album ARSEF 1941]|uniref:Peroxisomal membrane protein PEX14 n=1 Tax=Metarhizium album (strain ARSEF 1941) TaxID=1081103 RepID=A0A0B2WY94_METAS|nr:peroxin 14/17 [Metarhizium album ARSEF 1941]KHN97805.1 peroxin 14/17 [Metarhizium album ARSEF 1941]
MADSEQNKKPAASVPAWQREASAETTNEPEPLAQQTDYHQQLQIARRFLDEDQIKSASPVKKAEFLRSKGISEADIQQLLGHPDGYSESSSQDNYKPESTQTTSTSQTAKIPSAASNRPPIVTYPEFLVKPERPPPLVTKNGIVNTMYTFAGLSAILYATSKYLVAPMVDNLTDARIELHDVTYKRLDSLVGQLEKMVSVIPSAIRNPALSEGSDGSDAEDPSEMFHRDVGTQTSLIDRNGTPAPKALETASKSHADILTSLTKSVSIVKDQFRAQSEGFEDVKTLLDLLRDDLDGMTYEGRTEYVGGFDIYGSAKRNEPEDEIRKVRDNIRRVKGVLLSTRNFPASTR